MREKVKAVWQRSFGWTPSHYWNGFNCEGSRRDAAIFLPDIDLGGHAASDRMQIAMNIFFSKHRANDNNESLCYVQTAVEFKTTHVGVPSHTHASVWYL